MDRNAAYIRQSLVDKHSSSPERQRDTTNAFAATRSWIINDFFVDVGGKRSDSDDLTHRPNFQRMMNDARAKKFKRILVSSQERFGTSDVYSFYALMGELRNLGIEVWDCTAGIIINPPGYQLGRYIPIICRNSNRYRRTAGPIQGHDFWQGHQEQVR